MQKNSKKSRTSFQLVCEQGNKLEACSTLMKTENIRKKRKLMSFAGALRQKDAEDILNSVKNSRMDKDWSL